MLSEKASAVCTEGGEGPLRILGKLSPLSTTAHHPCPQVAHMLDDKEQQCQTSSRLEARGASRLRGGQALGRQMAPFLLCLRKSESVWSCPLLSFLSRELTQLERGLIQHQLLP